MSSSLSTDQRKALVRQSLEMCWNIPEGCVSPDAHLQSIVQDTAVETSLPHIYLGAERFSTPLEQVYRTLRTTFPDLGLKVTDIIVEDQKVVARWIMHGTDLGGFEGHLPTGRSIHLTGMLMVRFEADAMVEVWNEVDMAGLLHQLGFVYISQPPRVTVRRPGSAQTPFA